MSVGDDMIQGMCGGGGGKSRCSCTTCTTPAGRFLCSLTYSGEHPHVFGSALSGKAEVLLVRAQRCPGTGKLVVG